MVSGNLISSSAFGKRVYALRKKAGYDTPRELALVLCGYSKTEKGFIDDEAKRIDRMRRNIQNWEQGKNIPSAQMVATLCNQLDCDPDYLLYEDAAHPRKEVKSAADFLKVSPAAIEALLHIGYMDDAFVDEDENDVELDPYLRPSTIMSALFESNEFADLITDLMRSRSFICVSRTANRILDEIENMSEEQQERFERKSAELSGWAYSLGYALLSGNGARDLYIQKAADRIKAFENRQTDYCENEHYNSIKAIREARYTNEPVSATQAEDFCWDDFLE